MIKYCTKKPFTIIVAALLVCVFGFTSFWFLTREFLPHQNLQYIVVETAYQGSGGRVAVENNVTIPLEQAIANTPNVANILSESHATHSRIVVELEYGADSDSTLVTLALNVSNAISLGLLCQNALTPVIFVTTESEATSQNVQQDTSQNRIFLNIDYGRIVRRAVTGIDGLSEDALFGVYFDAMQSAVGAMREADILPDSVYNLLMGELENQQQFEWLFANTLNSIFAEIGEAQAADIQRGLLGGGINPSAKTLTDLIQYALNSAMADVPLGNLGDNLLVVTGGGLSRDELFNLALSYSSPLGFEDNLNQILLSLLAAHELYNVILPILEIMLILNPDFSDVILDIVRNIIENADADLDWILDIIDDLDISNAELLLIVTFLAELNQVFGGWLSGVDVPQSTVLFRLADVVRIVEVAGFTDDGQVSEYNCNMARTIGQVVIAMLIASLISFFVVWIFLRKLKVTATVMVVLLFATLFAVFMMFAFGISINALSMAGIFFGLAFATANCILIMEDIYKHKRDGTELQEAVLLGVRQSRKAVLTWAAVVLLSVLPIVFIQGAAADIFYNFAMPLAFMALGTLICSLTLLPSLAAKLKSMDKLSQRQQKVMNWHARFKRKYKAAEYPKWKKVVFTPAYLVGKAVSKQRYSDVGGLFESFRGLIVKAVEFCQKVKAVPIAIAGVLIAVTVVIAPFMNVNAMHGIYDDPTTIRLNIYGEETSTLNEQAVRFIGQIEGLDDVANVVRDLENSYRIEIDASKAAFRGLGAGQILDQVASVFGNEVPGVNVRLLDGDNSKVYSILIYPSSHEVVQWYAARDVEGVTHPQNIFDRIFIQDVLVENQIVRQYYVTRGIGLKFWLERDDTDPDLFRGILGADSVGIVVRRVSDEINVTVYERNPIVNVFDLLRLKINYADGSVALWQLLTDDSFTQDSMGRVIRGDDGVPLALVRQALPSFYSRLNGERHLPIYIMLRQNANAARVARQITEVLDELTLPHGVTFSVSYSGFDEGAVIGDVMMVFGVGAVLILLALVAFFKSIKSAIVVILTVLFTFMGSILFALMAGIPISILWGIAFTATAAVMSGVAIRIIEYIAMLKEQGVRAAQATVKAVSERLRPLVIGLLSALVFIIAMSAGRSEMQSVLRVFGLTGLGGLLFGTILGIFAVPVIYELLDKVKIKVVASGIAVEQPVEETGDLLETLSYEFDVSELRYHREQINENTSDE